MSEPEGRPGLVVSHWPFIGVMVAYGLSAFLVPTMAPVAISDDAMYGRSVEILLRDGELTILPLSAATQVFQTAWAALFGLVLGDDLGVFRLSTVVLTGLAGWACFGLCRELGVDRSRSALGAAAYLFNPLGYVLSFTFFTDAPLAALIVIAAYGYARGLRQDGYQTGWLVAGSAAAAAAFLVRQQGVLVVVAVVSYLIASRRLRFAADGARLLAATAGAPLVAVAVYYGWAKLLHGLPSEDAQTYVAGELTSLPSSWDRIGRLTFIEAVYPGLFLLPVAAAAVFAVPRLARHVAPTGWAVVGAWAATVVAGFALVRKGVTGFVPAFFTATGLGPPGDLRGGRPPLLGTAVWRGLMLVLTLACVLSVLVILLAVLRRRSRPAPVVDGRAHLLLWLLFWQAGGVIATSVVLSDSSDVSRDRYLLPLLPLAVCVALWALREVRLLLPVGWAVMAGVAMYSVAGTHDFLSQQQAVWALGNDTVTDGVARTELDAGAGWDAYHLYEYSIARDAEFEPVPGPLLLSRHDVDAWWIPFYAPVVTSEYVITSEPLNLYATRRRVEYSSWLRGEPTYVYLVRRSDMRSGE